MIKKISQPLLINVGLSVLLLTTVLLMTFWQLSPFAALPDSMGNLIDRRELVLFDIRLPRILLAITAGATLAIAGAAMQGLFQNPLASPGLLGCSAGATTAGVFILYYVSVPTTLLLAGGTLGALLSFIFVYFLAYQRGSTMIILAGVAVNALLAAVMTLLLSNADSPWALAELYRWLQGSLALATFSTQFTAAPILLVGLGLVLSQRHYLDFLSFGEETAATMGINPKLAFFLTALGVAMLTGAIIPQTGGIGFIGLIAPHFARLLLKKPPSQLYLTSGLLGALLLLLADLLVWRVPFFSRVYIGTLTAIIGAPCLLWILLSQKRLQATP